MTRGPVRECGRGLSLLYFRPLTTPPDRGSTKGVDCVRGVPLPRPLPVRSSRRGENFRTLRTASNCTGNPPPYSPRLAPPPKTPEGGGLRSRSTGNVPADAPPLPRSLGEGPPGRCEERAKGPSGGEGPASKTRHLPPSPPHPKHSGGSVRVTSLPRCLRGRGRERGPPAGGVRNPSKRSEAGPVSTSTRPPPTCIVPPAGTARENSANSA
jgi:hypothetical protein